MIVVSAISSIYYTVVKALLFVELINEKIIKIGIELSMIQQLA